MKNVYTFSIDFSGAKNLGKRISRVAKVVGDHMPVKVKVTKTAVEETATEEAVPAE